ncbi:unnamed protein product [Dibothriocephalus latus]|uniref:CRAL-TRIO domain-containing protein n=1 Tax=Dibothriocephalus latus TaxID=60516 RepID=A0A3P7NL55_DIBLA|nr:unnamed protein product [Dibothriocephalus latus]
MIYLNMPTVVEVFFKAASSWFNEKTKSKILVLQKDLKPAYESVPGLEELMPSEYNGGNGSFDEICVCRVLMYRGMTKEENYISESADFAMLRMFMGCSAEIYCEAIV